ncbi:hypothetical protein FNV43_RR14955 [Rhamnella rubrinervis]|uniref:Uncharacterized protein n=1 Tax=Rhamnella rubrinervis TaxID=2594499 RepID=A0A8K0H3R6_9ROSA|nr:hypothetical protein FNV43_RR14955 [Rhamnella rubrinervis]
MATKFALFTGLSNRPFASPPTLSCRKRPYGGALTVAASREANNGGQDFDGRLVDENMIELRIRIQEMKMLEMSGDDDDHAKQLRNSNWMEWEKQYFEDYKEDVYEGIGLLQNCLMNVRPGLALGCALLVSLSLLVSSGLVFFQLIELSKQIFYGFH